MVCPLRPMMRPTCSAGTATCASVYRACRGKKKETNEFRGIDHFWCRWEQTAKRSRLARSVSRRAVSSRGVSRSMSRSSHSCVCSAVPLICRLHSSSSVSVYHNTGTKSQWQRNFFRKKKKEKKKNEEEARPGQAKPRNKARTATSAIWAPDRCCSSCRRVCGRMPSLMTKREGEERA
jgi:hypothetical protein